MGKERKENGCVHIKESIYLSIRARSDEKLKKM